MHNSRKYQMEWLRRQGFEVVEYRMVTGENLDEAMVTLHMRSRKMIFHQMGSLHYMMILPMENHSEVLRNFPGMRLLLNGPMK